MKIKKNLKIAIWLVLLFSVVLSILVPKSILSSNFNIDKIAHFTSYFFLTYFAIKTFNTKKSRNKIILLLIILAIVLEYFQIYIPHREFSYQDMAMNLFGVLGGIILFKIIK